MLKEPGRVRNNKSAHDRFLKPTIMNFFAKEFPMMFGSLIREKIATELINIFDTLNQDQTKIQPGQILWNALDKNTRASSSKKNFVPVVLTILSDGDINELQNGLPLMNLREKVIARITLEAHKQGGILSMRDIGLLLVQNDTTISRLRKSYEKRNAVVLPHVGSLHDVGTCITHKMQIVYKAIVEKKDPVLISKETNHSQRSVDRYLQDFYRVETLYLDNKDIEYISIATNISKRVVNQYVEIIENYVKKCV